MALAEALGELGEWARGQKSRSSGTTPTGGSRGPGQSRLILFRTPLPTSTQLPAHENTAPAHLLSLCCAAMDLEGWRQLLVAQRRELLEDDEQDDLLMGVLVDQLGDGHEFEVRRVRHGGSRPGRRPNL